MLGANVGANVNKPIATNGKIEIAFDRLLDPQTIVRQAFPVRDANGSVIASPIVEYDPVTRVVTIKNPDANSPDGKWLEDDQFYTVTIAIPATDDDNGVRAIDRATLDPSAPRDARTISFYACDLTASKCAPGFGTPDDPKTSVVPAVDFCRDVHPIFEAQQNTDFGLTYRGHCSGSQCHAAPNDAHSPAAGLVLQTAEGIAKTAIDRPAQGATTAGKADETLPASRRFGVNMPVIASGSPAKSWLLYKVLLGRPEEGATPIAQRPHCYPNTSPAAPQRFPKPAAPFAPLGDDERRVLSDYVLGREMPYPSHPGLDPDADNDNFPLSIDEMLRLRFWIEQGARVQECGACDTTISCAAGWGNCNASIEDGCESNLSSATSCGSCAKVCTAAAPFCVVTNGQWDCAASSGADAGAADAASD